MKKQRFLFPLLMAVVMMAMSPMKSWAIGGSGTSSSPYTISSAADLQKFANIVNGANGETRNVAACAKLTADITLTSAWTPMGTSSAYTGTFDGQGHTISGMSITASSNNVGLFALINGATIKNFTLAGTIESPNYSGVGSAVGRANGASKILDVQSSVNITVNGAHENIGGIVGWIESTTQVSGCTYTGTLDAGSSFKNIGGIVGYSVGNAKTKITNSFFAGTIKTTATGSNGETAIGGILGYIDDSSSNGTNFQGLSGCFHKGTLPNCTTKTNVAAIIGRPRGSSYQNVKNNTYLSGTADKILGNDYESKCDASNKAITISVTAGANGSVSQSYVNPTSTTATKLHVEAAPKTGYHFTKWSDNNTTANRNDVALTDNVRLTATFAAHTYGDAVWTWASDGKSASAVITCTACGNELSGNAAITSAVKTAATCTAKGTTTYTAKVTLNGKEYTSTKDVVDINMLNHSMTTHTATAATCTATGNYLYYTCSRSCCTGKYYKGNDAHTTSTYTNQAATVIAALGHGQTNGYTPTYTWSNDINAHTCSFTLKCKDCNTNVVSNKQLTGTQTAHTDATCTANGSTTYKVTGSYTASGSKAYSVDKSNTYTIPALGHKEVIDPAVAATCTTTGLTEGKHCSVCNAVFIAQQTVAALGHKEVIDPAVAATCTTTGLTEGKHCSVCNAVLIAQQTVSALGHDFSQKTATSRYLKSAANCLHPAAYFFSCSKCGEKEDNTDHLFFDGWLGDHEYTGEEMPPCRNCGQPFGEEAPEEIRNDVLEVQCSDANDGKYANAFDNNPNTHIDIVSGTSVEFTTVQYVNIVGYSFRTGSHLPSNWVLKGNYDRIGWIVIDTKTNVDTQEAKNAGILSVTLDPQPVRYNLFRLEFTGDEGAAISEISLTARFTHDMTEHAAVPATCTTTGIEKYWTCSHACCEGKYFKNEEGSEEWGALPVIALLSHQLDSNNTCTECGYHANITSKAVYNNGTLTFYHDDKDHEGEGTYIYSLNSGTSTPLWNTYALKSSITSVVFDESFADARPTTCYYWFYGLSKLSEIKGIEYLNTENVNNMNSMFGSCLKLQSLDVTKFNTEKVTNMNRMFSGCTSLQSLDVTKFNTENVTDMSYMFNNCLSLQSLDVTKFNTAAVMDMSYMFYNCLSLQQIDLTNFNTEKVTNMSYMFSDCRLQSLDVTKFNTEKVTNMSYMFSGCSSLQSLDLTNFNTGIVTDMSYMFNNCSSLQSLDVTKFNTEKVTNMLSMFNNCSNLQSLDLTKFNTGIVTSMSSMFNNCSSLNSLDVTNFDTKNTIYMSGMFRDCKKLQSLDLTHFNTGMVTTMGHMFNGCSSLQSLDLSNFNTEKVTSMSYMFSGCSSLQSLDVTKFNTEKVTDMSCMFYKCKSLQSLGLTGFNTETVTSMKSMFDGCKSLQSLDLRKFNTEKVTSMNSMFSGCSGLQSLDLTNFNTEKVTNMNRMFESCSSLAGLDLSSFNTEKVTDMGAMFQGCDALESLEVSNFNMQKVSSVYSLLDASALKTLTLKSVPFLKDQTFNTKFTGDGVTVNYVLEDNSVIYTGATNNLPAATSATYTRQMSAASQWGTVVLPFDAVSNEDVQLYELMAVTGDQMTFSPVGNVTANTPCVFKKKVAGATSVTFTGNNVSGNIPATPSAEAGATGWTAKGTYSALSNQTGMYFIAQNKFWKADAPITIAPFRAWFEGSMSAGGKALNIVVEEDDADGILNITNQLDGRDGKYLENSHVVIVKNGKKFNLNGQKIK